MKYVPENTPATLKAWDDELPYTVVWSSPSGHRLWAIPDRFSLKPGFTLWDPVDDKWDINQDPKAEGDLFVWKEGGYYKMRSDHLLVVGERRAKYSVGQVSRDKYLVQPPRGSSFILRSRPNSGITLTLDHENIRYRNLVARGNNTPCPSQTRLH